MPPGGRGRPDLEGKEGRERLLPSRSVAASPAASSLPLQNGLRRPGASGRVGPGRPGEAGGLRALVFVQEPRGPCLCSTQMWVGSWPYLSLSSRVAPSKPHPLRPSASWVSSLNQCGARAFKTCDTCVVRGTALFSLRLSNEKMTIAVHCELAKIIPFFRSDRQKTYFRVCVP